MTLPGGVGDARTAGVVDLGDRQAVRGIKLTGSPRKDRFETAAVVSPTLPKLLLMPVTPAAKVMLPMAFVVVVCVIVPLFWLPT